MATRLDFERVYPHPRSTVWRALTEPDLLSRWLMPVEGFRAEVGCHFRFVTEPAPGFDGIVSCEVLAVDPPESIRFSWRGGPLDTVVAFHLEEVAGGTRLRFEQTGFRGFKAWLTSAILRSGFRKMYGQLLPELLVEIDGKADGAAEDEELTDGSPTEDPVACGGPIHRARVRLLRFFRADGSG